MIYDIKQIQEFYDLARLECSESRAWEFEKHFAQVVTNHCAQIVEDCVEMEVPKELISAFIRKGGRLKGKFFSE